MTHLLLALAAILSPRDASTADAVRAAIEQPDTYLEAHEATAERLSASATPSADPALAWLALVDELIQRHYAVELDWNTDPADLLWNLERLDGFQRLSEPSKLSVRSLRRDDAATVGWLREIADIVATDQQVVATMDIDSDSHVVLLLNSPDYQSASRHAGQLGFLLTDIREHDPNQ